MGGGAFSAPLSQKKLMHLIFPIKMFLNFWLFNLVFLTAFGQFWIPFFWEGATLKAPRKEFKILKLWKVTPVTSLNAQFLLKNLFMLSNIGGLQKIRAQYLHWYSNFKFERKKNYFSWKYFFCKKMSIVNFQNII